MKRVLLYSGALILLSCFNAPLDACINQKQTRPIVIDIFCSLTTCCADLKETITECCQDILVSIGCNATLIRQADVGATGYIISSSGVYRLTEDILYTGSASAITITANNVQLDLSCFSLSTLFGARGIDVGSNLSDIKIINGSINGFFQSGIALGDGTSNVECSNIAISECTTGISCNGILNSTINLVDILDCDFTFNGIGIHGEQIVDSRIERCTFRKNSRIGIELITSFTNEIIDCSIKDIVASIGSAYGIRLVDGGCNIVKECTIVGISTLSTSSQDQAAGIFLNEHEQQDKIEENQVAKIMTSSFAIPYGIHMAYSFTALTDNGLPTIDISSTITTTINVVKWSFDDRFLAVGGDFPDPQIRVFEFFDTTLNEVASFIVGTTVLGLDWSPDRRYLAFAATTTQGIVSVLEFNETNLSLVATFSQGAATKINGVSWSPNGRYIAIGGDASLLGNEVSVLKFTGSALNLVATFTHGAHINSVDWSSDSRFLAIAGEKDINAVDVRVLEFNGTSLDLLSSFTRAGSIIETSVVWSPNDHYLATAGFLNIPQSRFVLHNIYVHILDVNSTSTLLNSLAEFFDVNFGYLGVDWSCDGRFIAIGGTTSFFDKADTRILEFTGNSLDVISSFTHGGIVFSVSWMSNGQYLAIGGQPGIGGAEGRILSALQFPPNSLIVDNSVSSVQGPNAFNLRPDAPGVSSGRGIQASSGNNLIIRNTAFNNNLNYLCVSTERFKEFITNIRLRNTFPNTVSNVEFPPL